METAARTSPFLLDYATQVRRWACSGYALGARGSERVIPPRRSPGGDGE